MGGPKSAVVRVQTMSNRDVVPGKFILPPLERPPANKMMMAIPVIDLGGSVEESVLSAIADACKEWGFFEVVNHGLSDELLGKVLKVWKEFFHLPLQEKEKNANDPITLEGYGSSTGYHKDTAAALDWNDFYFVDLATPKWPSNPSLLREISQEYSQEVVKLCSLLLKMLSRSLGLEEKSLEKKFGGGGNTTAAAAASLNVSFYPVCPQPELTMGLSSHTDPGGITILLADHYVQGLQVWKGEEEGWINVKPSSPNALIVNMGDKIEVLSNGLYKSVEHRVVSNSKDERLSLALFYDPRKELDVQPAQELVSPGHMLHYLPAAYKDYKKHIKMMLHHHDGLNLAAAPAVEPLVATM